MNSNPKVSDSANGSIPTSTDVRLPANRYVLFFALAGTGCLADLITKSYVFNNFYDPERFPTAQDKNWFVEGVFGLQTSTNPGALFGMGAGYSWLFALISLVAIICIFCWLFVWKVAFDRWLTVTMGMVTGGILGNLYDRLGFGYIAGYPIEIKTNVRDWVLFQIEGIKILDPWPNFNIADCLLVCGAISLVVHAIFFQPPNEIESESSDG